MKVLVINAGSSSVKYYLYQMPQAEVLARGLVERIGEETSELSHFFHGKTYTIPAKVEDVEKAMELILETLVNKEVGVLQQISEIGAVGHRVVHGGEEFTGSVIIVCRPCSSTQSAESCGYPGCTAQSPEYKTGRLLRYCISCHHSESCLYVCLAV